MKAWAIEGSFGVENLHLVERSVVDPGPYQVRVRMRAVSLNFRDLLMVRGQYDPRIQLLLVPLSDGVGVIEAVGEGVTRVAVGDRVAGIFSQKRPDPARVRQRLEPLDC